MASPAPALPSPVESTGTGLPFVLASDREILVGRGVVDVVTHSVRDGLTERVASVLRDASLDRAPHPAVVVGAIPFDPDRAAHLIRPARLEFLEGDAALPPIRSTGEPQQGGSGWRVTAEPPKGDYADAVARVLTRFGGAHGLRKVVLARSLVVESERPIDLDRLITRLRRDRSATTFMVPLADQGEVRGRLLVGASPELLLSKQGPVVLSHPLAGSARRSPDPVEDARAAARLEASEKDRREHASVVEWVVDRLRPFCRHLTVPTGPSLVSTETMWHLGTRVEGMLRDDAVSSLELAAALHPTPAVCGQPPEAASDTIAELESFDRGYFGGAVGWCDAAGNGRWLVTIRCAEIRDRTARLYAGAGIVAGSDPDAETAETSAKFAALLRALGVDEEGRALALE